MHRLLPVLAFTMQTDRWINGPLHLSDCWKGPDMRRAAVVFTACLLAAACVTRPVEETTVSTEPADTVESDTDTGADVEDAVASVASTTAPDLEPMQVTGSLTYRQRVALPADAVVSLSLWEHGLALYVPEPFHSETIALNGRQVPVPFEIDIDNWKETRGTMVRLEARIADAAGTLLWTNNDGTAFTKEAGLVDLGSVRLSPEPEAVVTMPQLAGREWMVARIDGEPLLQTTRATVRFGEDGRISGNASCNAFTGSFKLNAGILTIAPLATTRKACVPQLMEQEQAIISVLQTVSYVEIDETGLLTLQNEEGTLITARQGAS